MLARSSRSHPALEAVVDRLGGDALIVVDPNCRPSAVDDRGDAYCARLARVLSHSDVAKVREDDVAWLESADRGRRGPSLLERGPAIGLLTSTNLA